MEVGIAQVSYGWLDIKETQDPAEYRAMGLSGKLIDDPSLRRICGNLYGLFDQLYGPDGTFAYLLGTVNPWERIKEIIGESPFR
jgi:hypothetical protein